MDLVSGAVLPQSPWLFPLNLVSLPVRIWEPPQNAADLRVSLSRILLLFGETELSPFATPRSLKLGLADITDCVVLSKVS